MAIVVGQQPTVQPVSDKELLDFAHQYGAEVWRGDWATLGWKGGGEPSFGQQPKGLHFSQLVPVVAPASLRGYGRLLWLWQEALPRYAILHCAFGLALRQRQDWLDKLHLTSGLGQLSFFWPLFALAGSEHPAVFTLTRMSAQRWLGGFVPLDRVYHDRHHTAVSVAA